jgi:predicted DNA-binding transcriptional regulator AlpA
MTDQIAPTPLDAERIVNAEAAAHMLGISSITLARWRVVGGGPKFLKLGRSVRYRLTDLETWLTKQQHENTSQYREAC